MGFRIEHRIGVQAPAEVIWNLIADLPGWSSWNPIYKDASGRIGIGEKLSMTLTLPGEVHRPLQPRVLDWEPNAQLVWRLDLMPWLAHTVRYLEIEVLSDAGCIFANGEFFHGAVGERVGRAKRRAIFQGFSQLGEAVKAIAERRWREDGGRATSPG